MSIKTQTFNLFPVRRDKEISSSTTGGGGGGSSVGSTSTASNSAPYDDTTIKSDLATETTNRIAGDISIHNEVTGETASRISADSTEVTNRTNADNAEAAIRFYEDNRRLPLSGGTLTNDVFFNTGADIQSSTYVSGYAGSGYKLDNASENTLEVDNLKVRNKLSAYELEINEISSIGGSLLVSAANGIPYLVSGTRFYFDEDGGANPITFAVNDYCKAQIWTGAGTGSYLGQVTAVVHSATLGNAYIDCTTVSGTPWSKMKLVQIGNSSNSGRQSVIYITSSDTNNPYIDMCSGVVAGSLTGKQRLRIGNLSGITDAAFGGALSGYGLYADNVFLKGSIVIASGSSGYSNFTDKPTIPTNTNQLTDGANLGGTATWSGVSGTGKPADNATVGATWGSNLNSVPAFLGTPGSAGLYIGSSYMGYYNGSSWVNYMDNAGNASFTGIATIGTTSVGGSNCTIMGASLNDTAYGADGGTMYINNVGYQGGNSYYRNFIVGNGKDWPNGLLIYATGSNKRVGIRTNSAPDSTFMVGTNNGAGLKINYNEGGTNLIYGTLTSDNTITATNFILSSDERLKENIKSLRFKHIPIKYKEFNLKSDKEQKRIGVIAQELKVTNPEFVREDKEGMLSVAYIDLLMAKVSELEARIKELESR
jgi:hypothetical protein